ncbi:MAG: hypothetical protein KatS3mg029_0881 [Saprospiraceae bacterium]|nr:MAG: hypothetical protein KatS3mg029_0881 [Saprospiraceae bacterium]
MRLQILLLALLMWHWSQAQEVTGYQMPSPAIAELIDAPPTPAISLSPDNSWMLILDRQGLPTIEELGREELRLAGLRLDPLTNGPSRSSYYVGLAVKALDASEPQPIEGLPAEARISEVRWSTDGKRIGFLHTTGRGIELWVADVQTRQARRLTNPVVNDVVGSAWEWLDSGSKILFKRIPADRGPRPAQPQVPAGPVIQSNEGVAAPVRTYQDLLNNPHDEALFEYYATAELALLDLSTGRQQPFGVNGLVVDFSVSPDGKYVLVERLERPFSYIVPWYRFPRITALYRADGKLVRTLAQQPLTESLPKGFNAVPEGPRSFGWRADHPAMLYWVEARDGGDPNAETEVRDQLMLLPAPFDADPIAGPTFELRFSGVTWGDDGLAITEERWWRTRRAITRKWRPAAPSAPTEVLFDRSYEDRYGDPGNFETTTNRYGRQVLLRADGGQSLFLTGQGASPAGNRPFVDRYDLHSGKTERLWRCEGPWYEVPIAIVDAAKGEVLTRRESTEVQPNYFLRNWKTGSLTQLTKFPNPYERLEGVKKEFIRFKRADGVEMSGTLYLPPGYDKEKDGPLPVFMWAYPREFKDADAAGQVTSSPYEFIRVSPSSPILWVVEGYAVFNDVSMPVVGEGDAQPNETFVEQLRMNAEAAVKVLADMGVGDPNRVAIGGHSYGAFMTANLLAHTDLFAAGIARSGAYNRTLTPFGFQSEERTYWEAPEVYYKMSPFNFADKIKEPLLLIHGEADNNSGTFPMQSERMYAALKGHGATVRLVMLPHESHGYRARESLMHLAWETSQWLDKYVKNRKPEQP